MKYFIAGLFLCLSAGLYAQQNHFIYIQTDNRQPFYVKLDRKLLSSSASGYLIIPKLPEGSYNLTIGFPRNEWPDEYVTCKVEQDDQGFQLKNFGDKGWGLFNFISMNLMMASNKIPVDSPGMAAGKVDSFTVALSDGAKDPSFRRTEQKAESVDTDKKTAGPAPEPKATVKILVQPVSKVNPRKAMKISRDRVTKLSHKWNAERMKMVYIDMVNGKADTVTIEIPFDHMAKNAGKGNRVISKKNTPAKKEYVGTSVAQKNRRSAKSNVKPGIPRPDMTLAEKHDVNILVQDSLAAPGVAVLADRKDLTKTDANILYPLSDSTGGITAEKKPEEVKTDVVKADNNIVLEPLKDTTVTAVPEKKPEEVKTLAVKPGIDNVLEPLKDSTVITEPEKKPEEAKTDVGKAENEGRLTIKDKVVTLPPGKKELDVSSIESQGKVNSGVRAYSTAGPAEKISVSRNADLPVVHYECRNTADGDDFLGLRRKMSKAGGADEMMGIAQKEFVKKCFYSKQLERLCILFNDDELRFLFLRDAYQHVADLENFSLLEPLLTGEDHIKRFRAILRQGSN